MWEQWKFKPAFLRVHAANPEHPGLSRRKNTRLKLLGLSCALLAGVLLGSVCQVTAESSRYATYFVRQYLNGIHGGGFTATVSGTFLSSMTMQAVVLFFSLSCIGAPVLLCLPFLRGVSIGCVSAYLYNEMGSRGLLANLILLWIPEVLRALLLIFFVSIALDTSVSLFRLNFLARSPSPDIGIKRCLHSFVLISFGMLLVSMLEGVLDAVFAPVLLGLSA